ncbi:unnamed protein product [Lathyrus oleraceus]
MEKKSIMHYNSSHKILLVGEGDFSFSLCLARAFGSAVNMVATSFNDRAFLARKYTSAITNLRELKRLGCTILYEVDVHDMNQHPYLKLHKNFDRIIFNFPHCGIFRRETEYSVIRQHQKLVKGFLRNSKNMLSLLGEIHITHKTTFPYSCWNINNLAEKCGLSFIEEVEFYQYCYPGYENKRGAGSKCYQSFPLGACSTFKFKFEFENEFQEILMF